MTDYVSKTEFNKVVRRCGKIEKKIDDITNNHLTSIRTDVGFISREVKNLRWFILSLGIILAILEVWGG